jgi:hypothetical protein
MRGKILDQTNKETAAYLFHRRPEEYERNYRQWNPSARPEYIHPRRSISQEFLTLWYDKRPNWLNLGAVGIQRGFFGGNKMERIVTVRGKILDPRRIELDEPLADLRGDVEVVVKPAEVSSDVSSVDVFELISRLPPGRRSKSDIDRQMGEEREAWGERWPCSTWIPAQSSTS